MPPTSPAKPPASSGNYCTVNRKMLRSKGKSKSHHGDAEKTKVTLDFGFRSPDYSI